MKKLSCIFIRFLIKIFTSSVLWHQLPTNRLYSVSYLLFLFYLILQCECSKHPKSMPVNTTYWFLTQIRLLSIFLLSVKLLPSTSMHLLTPELWRKLAAVNHAFLTFNRDSSSRYISPPIYFLHLHCFSLMVTTAASYQVPYTLLLSASLQLCFIFSKIFRTDAKM